jgi:hypothetical protein
VDICKFSYELLTIIFKKFCEQQPKLKTILVKKFKIASLNEVAPYQQSDCTTLGQPHPGNAPLKKKLIASFS